jgi:hypothetical protein
MSGKIGIYSNTYEMCRLGWDNKRKREGYITQESIPVEFASLELFLKRVFCFRIHSTLYFFMIFDATTSIKCAPLKIKEVIYPQHLLKIATV